MRNVYGWSLAGVVLCGGLALAQQGTTGQTRPGQTQPGQALPSGQNAQGQGQGQGVRGQAQPSQVRGGQRVQQGQVVPRGQAGQQGQSQAIDQQIAAVIAACNRNEVETAKFAMSRLQSDEAKEIATLMIKEHTAGMEKFNRFAGTHAVSTTGGSDDREGRQENRDGQQRRNSDARDESRDNEGNQNRNEGRNEGRRDTDGNRNTNRGDENTDRNRTSGDNAAASPNNPGNRVAGAQSGAGNTGASNPGTASTRTQVRQGTTAQSAPGAAGQSRVALRPQLSGEGTWTAIHREIADESLAACKKELSRYEGKDFDKAYLGHQLAAHMKVATELKVFRNHVSNQLASEIDQAHAMTEKHIKHLREVMEEKKDEK